MQDEYQQQHQHTQLEPEQSPGVVAYNIKRANQVGIMWAVPRMIATAVVLAVSNGRGETCAEPLSEWAVALLAQDVLRTPLRLYILMRIKALYLLYEDPDAPNTSAASSTISAATAGGERFKAGLQKITRSRAYGASRWFSYAVLALYISGFVWLLRAGDCARSSPHLYRLCLALSIILGVFIAINLCCGTVYFGLVLIFRCCGPSIMAWRNRHLAGGAEAGGGGLMGLSLKEIENIQSVTFDPVVHGSCDTCAVCLSEFDEGQQCRKLQCNHLYHQSCIDEWLKVSTRCPLCNADAKPICERGFGQAVVTPAPISPDEETSGNAAFLVEVEVEERAEL